MTQITYNMIKGGDEIGPSYSILQHKKSEVNGENLVRQLRTLPDYVFVINKDNGGFLHNEIKVFVGGGLRIDSRHFDGERFINRITTGVDKILSDDYIMLLTSKMLDGIDIASIDVTDGILMNPELKFISEESDNGDDHVISTVRYEQNGRIYKFDYVFASIPVEGDESKSESYIFNALSVDDSYVYIRTVAVDDDTFEDYLNKLTDIVEDSKQSVEHDADVGYGEEVNEQIANEQENSAVSQGYAMYE